MALYSPSTSSLLHVASRATSTVSSATSPFTSSVRLIPCYTTTTSTFKGVGVGQGSLLPFPCSSPTRIFFSVRSPIWKCSSSSSSSSVATDKEALDSSMDDVQRRLMFKDDIRATIDRYKQASADSSNSTSITEANSQYYQQESAKLRQQIQILQNANRHLMGDSLSSLSIKELKQLENRLERGITRIRSKKHELLFGEIEYMQKREVELQNDNMYLRAKIAENERVQQANMLSAPEFDTLPQFDSRNYFNLLEAAPPFSHQDQTALHLG